MDTYEDMYMEVLETLSKQEVVDGYKAEALGWAELAKRHEDAGRLSLAAGAWVEYDRCCRAAWLLLQ